MILNKTAGLIYVFIFYRSYILWECQTTNFTNLQVPDRGKDTALVYDLYNNTEMWLNFRLRLILTQAISRNLSNSISNR